ncbi:MAG TPA: 16S rRNA (guanine(527)-N(7))-methyltransferase RsmG [Xanthobacteraceae bacterium]|nr:16S rRNA (guanine(527)-N(7))-methyltransferase RsmG [Xanthobacteraceae bacterium]
MIASGGRRRRGGQAGQGSRASSRVASERPSDLAADRARALTLTPVSRETIARLDRFVDLLAVWQRRINLIAPSTESTLWTRHVADSLQLLALAPRAREWADLGSGAGFPGLIIACALAEAPGARVHLVESNAKKAAFLREAVRATGAPAMVHAERIENFVEHAPESIEVVTARALAPLAELLAAAYPLLKRGACGLFPKGRDAASELTEAAKNWKIRSNLAVSRTDPQARIVVVRGLEPISRPARGERFD